MFPAALSSRPWESEICAHTHHLIGWLGSNGSLGGDVSLVDWVDLVGLVNSPSRGL